MSDKSSCIGIGGVIAVVLSWSINHSVLWGVIHGLCGWAYLICWALGWVYTGTPEAKP